MFLNYLALLCALLLTTVVYGHSHLANPLPTRRLDCRVGDGRPRQCYGPCPAMDTWGQPTGVGPNRPAEVWKRGESRTISWHRNNHGNGESGFVRFTLVPVDKMMDKAAHQKFTFQISCWSAGPHRCSSRNVHVCGNDAEGMAYKVPITVPTSYPDGIYVFGWSWYGGGRYDGKSFFSDYWSCSFIKIQGGAAVTSSSKPLFVPGSNQKYSDSCIATTNRLGVCTREPCHIGSVKPMKPANLPEAIFRRDIDGQETPNEHVPETPEQPKPQQPKPKGDKKRREDSIRIDGMQIINVGTSGMTLKRRKSFVVKLSKFSRGFTLGLQVSGHVQKVTFEWQGQSHTEYVPPFVVNGNTDGTYHALNCRKGRTMHIRATAYGPNSAVKTATYKVKCR